MGGAGCFTLVLLSAMGSPFGTPHSALLHAGVGAMPSVEVRCYRPQFTPPGQLTAYLQERVFRT